MGYAIIRALMNLWAFGVFIFLMNATSKLLFGRVRPRRIIRAIPVILIWPLHLFSSDGINKLLIKLEKF